MTCFSNFTIEIYDEFCDLQATVITDLKGLDRCQLLESGNKLSNANVSCRGCHQTREKKADN